MNKIIVHTTEGCDYCTDVKKLLSEANVKFEDKPSKDNQQAWQRVMRITGLGTFPTFEVGNEFFVPGRDYNSPDQIVNYLKNYTKPEEDYPIELQLMQSFKTMAYSINQGITKMLQELKNKENDK